ncbi:carboxypeptidase-like regulatory domain-containing protein [Erythrobacter sp. YT30]|uniref:carboxypeptidase-like regulatory domain-containing protein n=1 Tax=Erythrobacter sp. YT30 TaxID=1735012 RepID=UPI00076BF1EC|nr:carboxypeptidase-like regulatory domain-containing protein [Erythrobacter sp. YT30]KWV91484.1 hypothetical protein AUC45_09545 [Erythrobacter sp. YT30]
MTSLRAIGVLAAIAAVPAIAGGSLLPSSVGQLELDRPGATAAHPSISLYEDVETTAKLKASDVTTSQIKAGRTAQLREQEGDPQSASGTPRPGFTGLYRAPYNFKAIARAAAKRTNPKIAPLPLIKEAPQTVAKLISPKEPMLEPDTTELAQSRPGRSDSIDNSEIAALSEVKIANSDSESYSAQVTFNFDPPALAPATPLQKPTKVVAKAIEQPGAPIGLSDILQAARPPAKIVEKVAAKPAIAPVAANREAQGAPPVQAFSLLTPRVREKSLESSRPATGPPLPADTVVALQPQPSLDLTPGTRTFPLDEDGPIFTIDDELILQLRVKGIDASDTIIAYGTRNGIYLPVGELTRILDLAIKVSDDGNYASGWFLSEDRTVTIDLRQQLLTTKGGVRPLMPAEGQAFEGEMFVLSDVLAEILPLELDPNLRTQSVLLTTLEPFPFEERMRRDAERAKLGARQARGEQERWPRQETPWLAASVPIGDVELRAVSDSALGERLEGDLRLAGDLAFMTAQAFLTTTTRDGLVASLIQLGRRDPDADLLGPLGATDFQFGDVATSSMPVGLRGRAGRGGFITNRPFESASAFEQIDLRGILPNGYEVELYRNDILVGSIANAVNSQYEFLEVPVDYGLNVFRLVFYGPQGQRREEVRKITVGDGRLAAGDLEYEVGAIQRGVNLLGVEGPNFNPTEGFGNWQAAARLAYGLSPDITAVSSLSYFENDGENDFVGTAGIRTGIGGLALRADGAVSDKGSYAAGVGTAGRALGGSFTLSHFEYGGGFVDELRSNTRDPLRRATELDFNTNVNFGAKTKHTSIPIAARLRHIEFADGRADTDAIFRGSYRLPGMVLSNTLEYSRDVGLNGSNFSQLIGNFDLATFRRSRTQLRGSVGYSLLQGPEITNVAGEIDYQLDDQTTVSGQASYSFNGGGLNVGASAIRDFDKFSLAFDGNYAFEQKAFSLALRLGFSFGRDPLRQRYFVAKPGQASSGAASVRAFQDMDGDRLFSEGDVPLKDVDFVVFNDTSTTDEDGMARLTQLGNGNRASIQVDPSTLPDILMAPVERGVEIVPRAGRFHVMDFPIVALSEIEGTVSFKDDASGRGVSGLRLQLIDERGEIGGTVRSERGGYFFFELIKPGTYTLVIDPSQAERLGICMLGDPQITVEPVGGIYSLDANVTSCGES